MLAACRSTSLPAPSPPSAITTLFWWTVLSPLGLLAVAVLCARRPRLRRWLTLVVLVPPMLALLPVAVMQRGLTRFAAAGAVVLLGAAIALAVCERWSAPEPRPSAPRGRRRRRSSSASPAACSAPARWSELLFS